MTINQNIEAAIAGLKAYNDMQAAWRANANAGGYAAHFRDCPNIPDHLRIDLLEQIVRFDDEPAETLVTLQFELGIGEYDDDGRDYTGRAPALSDAEFEFANSRGLLS